MNDGWSKTDEIESGDDNLSGFVKKSKSGCGMEESEAWAEADAKEKIARKPKPKRSGGWKLF
ncbi:MAG: hypothetical protein CMP22_02540 [Rickettsiales bacterium]|nr:hypothetical protein [Rickettsiales bacterium]|tara:strand:+ start:570 stop:755 length:186 start_codon:yes stop_codon:yes gene_type:complete